MGIPIVVGVTGHRALRTQDLLSLRAAVFAELKKLKETYANSSFIMLNSIASGADTLCAEVAVTLGIRLVCPLPLPIDDYRKDFSEADAERFHALIRVAENVFVVSDTQTALRNRTRDDCYRQAGLYVAEHSHVLLALWDGSPAEPNGCGTAEIVASVLNAEDEIRRGNFKAANDGAVLHILTKLDGSGIDRNNPEVRLLEHEPGCLKDTLILTDAFNADSQKHADVARNTEPLAPDAVLAEMEDSMRQIHATYQAADRLSLWFQSRYYRAMNFFTAAGALLVLFFLLYDEMESNFFLLCYGGVLIVYATSFLRTRRGQTHTKYLRYRMLSESLRAQLYLRAAGVEDNIGNAFTWTQKQESTWIKNAISALLIGKREKRILTDNAVKAMWIDGQLAYHQNAFRRTSAQQRTAERTAKRILAVSAAVLALVLILEFALNSTMTAALFKKPFPAFLLYHSGQTITLRNLMKILLGLFSVTTVFTASYYGKISPGRRSIDHDRMARLYTTAKEIYESGQADHDQVFLALAREEIIEIGNWFSYSRENTPSFHV